MITSTSVRRAALIAALVAVPGLHAAEVAGVRVADSIKVGNNELLLNGDLGLAGHRCLGSLIFASGSAMARHQREALLEGTQELLAKAAPAVLSGVTAPNENMLVLRCASPVVEPVMMLWKTMWSFWREELWGLQGGTPRIWSM